MVITGRITAALPETGGISRAGKTWRKREYIVAYDNTYSNYPKNIVFSVMNDNIERLNIQQDLEYDLEIDFTAREYQGKYYLQASCWKATIKSEAQPVSTAQQDWGTANPQPAEYAYPAPPEAQEESLPF